MLHSRGLASLKEEDAANKSQKEDIQGGGIKITALSNPNLFESVPQHNKFVKDHRQPSTNYRMESSNQDMISFYISDY
jgi:hypothetical protein